MFGLEETKNKTKLKTFYFKQKKYHKMVQFKDVEDH